MARHAIDYGKVGFVQIDCDRSGASARQRRSPRTRSRQG
jgi:hypothetical protein